MNLVVLSWEWCFLPGDICQCLRMVLILETAESWGRLPWHPVGRDPGCCSTPTTKIDLAPNGNSAETEKCWSKDLNPESETSLWPKAFFFFSLFSADELLLPTRTTNIKVTRSHAYIVRFAKNFLLFFGSKNFPSSSWHPWFLNGSTKREAQ